MNIVPNLLTLEQCQELSNIIRSKTCDLPGDNLVAKSNSKYGLAETEELLLNLTERISSVTGKKLIPTYSYCRIYHKGATMEKHVDREACEYSLSLRIAGDEWPLIFELDKPTPVQLNLGAGVLYKGLEIPHWRDEFLGDTCTQVFLHWVDANGPYANWKYDKRLSTGIDKMNTNIEYVQMHELLKLTATEYKITGIDNKILGEEVLEKLQYRSEDNNSWRAEDTELPVKKGSQTELLLNTIADFVKPKGFKIVDHWSQVHHPLEATNTHHHGTWPFAWVYYVKVPEGAGDLNFHFMDRFRQHVSPKEGSLILFPAWMNHSVSKNKSKEIRISIAGNLSELD